MLRITRLGCWCLVLLAVGGCADGPFYSLAAINPLWQSQWAEDEAVRPTLYQQVEELRQLRGRADELATLEQQEWSNRLARLIQNSENTVLRQEALATLATLPTPEAQQVIRGALQDSDRAVRILACQLVAAGQYSESVTDLIRVMNEDADFDVRMAAIRELRHFQDPRVVEALSVALDDRNPAMQRRAIETLREITGRDYRGDVTKWRELVRGGNPPEPEPPSMAERLRSIF